MARGDGKQAKQATASGKLSAYVKPSTGADDVQFGPQYVDWSSVNDYYIVGAVRAVVKEGGAIMFGSSRDKKSYSVRIYDGDAGQSYYFPCNGGGVEELDTFLLGLAALAGD